MQEIIDYKPQVQLVICINDRTGTDKAEIPSCGPHIKLDQVKEVKTWIRASGLTGRVICTASRCMGFCNEQGAVASIYPSGRFFKGINNIEQLKQIIIQELSSVG